MRDAHDKYANQEVGYLLQRVEGYDGLVVLASNFKSNIDDAFMRRFQMDIHFLVPQPSERLRHWQKAFPEAATLDSSIQLPALARKYELTGASIMNVVQYCCLQALSRGEAVVRADDIEDGIHREFSKEGKVLYASRAR